VTATAIFAVFLAAGTYLGIAAEEKSRQIDADIRRFLDQLDRQQDR
jgi:hypothetical protein